MATVSTPRDEKNKNPKSDDSNQDSDTGNGGKTFGNEPPVREPKPAKDPEVYELV